MGKITIEKTSFVCDAPMSMSDVGVAPCACSIKEVRFMAMKTLTFFVYVL
jgi:hypothetical protein